MDELNDNLITVNVDTRYLEDQSDPDENRFVFAYTITIRNRGVVPAKLLTRHWVITDANGKVVTWIAEAQAPNTIFPAGYRRNSFKAGDQVTVTVEPAKENQPMGRILEAVLANGMVLGRASSAGALP